MEYQTIDIKIDNSGKVFLEVSGAKGKQCLAFTKDLEKTIGTVEKRDLKPEFNDEGENEENYLSSNL